MNRIILLLYDNVFDISILLLLRTSRNQISVKCAYMDLLTIPELLTVEYPNVGVGFSMNT